MHPLLLPGCTPTPLAHYLKALGVLRLLSEQLPPDLVRLRVVSRPEIPISHERLSLIPPTRHRAPRVAPLPVPPRLRRPANRSQLRPCRPRPRHAPAVVQHPSGRRSRAAHQHPHRLGNRFIWHIRLVLTKKPEHELRPHRGRSPNLEGGVYGSVTSSSQCQSFNGPEYSEPVSSRLQLNLFVLHPIPNNICSRIAGMQESSRVRERLQAAATRNSTSPPRDGEPVRVVVGLGTSG